LAKVAKGWASKGQPCDAPTLKRHSALEREEGFMIGMHPIALQHGFLKLLAIGLLCLLSAKSWAVPSFARQTGMTCAACHTVFPELTPFGRELKLNGYVLDNIKQITGIDI
jgi:hypothetical protein